MTTIKLTIGGMHCSSCVERVRGILTGVDGVVSANVQLAEPQATLLCRDGVRPEDSKLAQTLADAGFSMGARR